MKIAIGNDHSAVDMKKVILEYLESKGYEVADLGTDSHESCGVPWPPARQIMALRSAGPASVSELRPAR